MQKRPLQLEILITTGYQESGDKVKDDVLRIDQTSYYLSSLLWFMNTAAKGYELLDIETEHKLFEFHTFRGHVENLSEIGIGIAEQLTAYSVSINNRDVSNVEISNAEMISRLINDNSVPEKISEALSYAVTDIFNQLPPEAAARQVENSPEYIEAVLSSHNEVKND